MYLLCLILVVLLLSFVFTWKIRRYALSKELLDIPNARSSHSTPTPRGGGMAIVVSFLLATVALWVPGYLPGEVFAALIGAGVGVALLGFLDDHGHIAARWRLLGHFSAAGWVLYWLSGIPPVAVLGTFFDLGWLGNALALFYLVWMLNLYNFMDGIDGIASVEAICVCLGACVMYWLAGYDNLIWAPMMLAVAATGFLLWNFPSAKIFMGDAGSGFLGIVLAALSLQSAWSNFDFFWAWLILLGVFIVDASFTLIRRFARGAKVYEAHRSHAYQHASRKFGRHVPVTISVFMINVFWLVPIALLVSTGLVSGMLGVVFAYLPLIYLCFQYSAGKPE